MVSNQKLRTHVAVYRNKFSLNLSVAPSLQQQLENGTHRQRKKAQDSICIMFQRAGAAKFGRDWARQNSFIKWTNLTLTPLEAASDATANESASRLLLFAPKQLVMTGACCENDRCFVCSELNDHHKCRNGCTLRFEAA